MSRSTSHKYQFLYRKIDSNKQVRLFFRHPERYLYGLLEISCVTVQFAPFHTLASAIRRTTL
jgi:hypothetical protein